LRRAQVNIEFILSVSIFLLIVSVLSYDILGSLPEFHREAVKDMSISRAYQISEILLRDEGDPKNWDDLEEEIKRIGLSDGRDFFLSDSKITELNNLCNTDYQNILKLFGIEKNIMVVNITNLDGESVVGGTVCSPPIISETAPKLWIRRFGILNDKIVKVDVLVY